MPIVVKPLNANLSHDTETFGSMVLKISLRARIVFSGWATSNIELQCATMVANNPSGMITLFSKWPKIPC